MATNSTSRPETSTATIAFALLLIDFANQRRLKVFGRMHAVNAGPGPPIATALIVPGHPSPVERGFLIGVEAFDWNCPQYITPRFTEAEVRTAFATGHQRLALGHGGVSRCRMMQMCRL